MDLSTKIMDFVNENYLSIVIGLVLILMAIIGYYAEKTNFGNKLKKENKKENNVDIDNVGLGDYVDNNSIVNNQNFENSNVNMQQTVEQIQPMEQVNQQIEVQSQPMEQQVIINPEVKTQPMQEAVQENLQQPVVQTNDNVVSINDTKVEETKDINLEEDFEKIISNDEAINNDLMVDIDNMQIEPMDSVNVVDNNAYAKLSANIDLPEINEFEKSGDVWKF